MTSTISNYSTLIDTTFPVAGIDNDTEGFRENSINVVRSLNVAATEITTLQIAQEGLSNDLNNATQNILNSLTNVVTYSTSAPVTSVGKVGDVTGMIYATTASVFVCFGPYVGTTTNIWAKVSTVGASW